MSRDSDSFSRFQRPVRRPEGAGSTAPLGADLGAKRPVFHRGQRPTTGFSYRINYRVIRYGPQKRDRTCVQSATGHAYKARPDMRG